MERSGTGTARPAGSADAPRARKTAIALVVLASVLLFLSIFAVWLNRQALNTDDWVETSTELLEDPDIQDAVADFLVEQLYAAVNVEAEIAKVLPERAQPLAGPAAGGIRELAGRAAHEALESPKVQEAWAQANRAAHEQLLALLGRDGGDVVSTQDGAVTLDLETLVTQLAARVGVDVAGKVPPQIGEVEVLRSDQIEAAQDGADLFETLTWVLVILTIAIYALAIWLGRGRRREVVRAMGFGMIAAGIAILAARNVAGGAVVDALSSTAGIEPAADATWRIATSLLAASGAAFIGYGIVVVIGAWLAGPRPVATALRRTLAPLFNSRPAAYGVLFAIIALIFWWAPTEGTQRLAPSLLLIVLLVVGYEALRRKTVAEFPGETWDRASERWRERAAGFRERRGAAPPSPQEERIRSLERLQELRAAGLLDDEELAREKARLLGEG
jgi:hypothetical protein